MSVEDDKAAATPAADPKSGLAGLTPAVEGLGPPVSPFTTVAHRVASGTSDERALRMRDAERAASEESTRAE